MVSRFDHRGKWWTVEPTGTAVGVATGFSPRLQSWGVRFSPEGGGIAVEGHVSRDPSLATEGQLRAALDVALLASAIDRSRYTWRTVDALSRETGIDAGEVYQLLRTSPLDFVESVIPAADGRDLFSTRRRYRADRSALGRYLDLLDSSSS